MFDTPSVNRCLIGSLVPLKATNLRDRTDTVTESPTDTLAASRCTTRVCTLVLSWSLVLNTLSCADPLENVPPVADPADRPQSQVDWSWCETEMPPLEDCGEWGSVSDIGGSVRAEDVCKLGIALREYLVTRNWQDSPINVRVWRAYKPSTNQQFGLTHLRVAIPDKVLSLWVVLDEETREITVYVDTP